MFNKKKSKRVKPVLSGINCEIRCIDKKVVLICSLSVLLGGLISFFAGGSPTYILRMLKMPSVLPTRWLFKLVWTVMYILIGLSLGIVLSCKERSKQIHKYRGSMLFVMMCIFNYIWYPLFFGSEAIFLALMSCVGIIILSFFALKNFSKVSKLSTLIMLGYIIWTFYLFCLNAIVLFIN